MHIQWGIVDKFNDVNDGQIKKKIEKQSEHSAIEFVLRVDIRVEAAADGTGI